MKKSKNKYIRNSNKLNIRLKNKKRLLIRKINRFIVLLRIIIKPKQLFSNSNKMRKNYKIKFPKYKQSIKLRMHKFINFKCSKNN